MLNVGDRIWVRIPKLGYVGVGIVEAPSVSITDFKLETDNGPTPAFEVLKKADYHREFADNPEMAEYFVKIRWLDTVPQSKAFHETGLFGQQNSVCKPTSPKWRQTVERLKSQFTKWEGK